MDWLHLAELIGTLAAAGWGSFERARAKRQAREAKEKEAARHRKIQETVSKIDMTGGDIKEILDRVKEFDELWRPKAKAKAKAS